MRGSRWGVAHPSKLREALRNGAFDDPFKPDCLGNVLQLVSTEEHSSQAPVPVISLELQAASAALRVPCRT